MSSPIDEQTSAYYRTMARQMAPAIFDMFFIFSNDHKVDPMRCYMVGRFKTESDLDKPENQVLEVKHAENKNLIERVTDLGGKDELKNHQEEYKFLSSLLPMFGDHMKDEAQHLGVPLTDIFILINLVKPAQGDKYLRLQIKCAGRKDWSKLVLDGKI